MDYIYGIYVIDVLTPIPTRVREHISFHRHLLPLQVLIKQNLDKEQAVLLKKEIEKQFLEHPPINLKGPPRGRGRGKKKGRGRAKTPLVKKKKKGS